jgi:hypothetical protein
MVATSFSICTILAEKTERTRGSSSAQIKHFIEASDSKINSFENEI